MAVLAEPARDTRSPRALRALIRRLASRYRHGPLVLRKLRQHAVIQPRKKGDPMSITPNESISRAEALARTLAAATQHDGSALDAAHVHHIAAQIADLLADSMDC